MFSSGGRLKSQCAKIRLPDDCSIGFVIGMIYVVQLCYLSVFGEYYM